MRKDLRILVSCELPRDVKFELEGMTLYIGLEEKGLISNMQVAPSAFEGWALGLMANYPKLIKDVVIEWTPLDLSSLKSGARGHYYRFLYRAYKFQKNYPTFVKINPEIPNNYVHEMSDDWVLNYPNAESKESTNLKPEAYLERKVLLPLMQERFAVADHQLPAGLFYKKKSSDPKFERTPRRLSQADLWSLGNDILTIYELKIDNNKPVGIISEILFYTNVMKDLTDHKINYPDEFFKKRKYHRHSKELADAILENKVKKVVGVLLANNLHPLITNKTKEVISMMSANTSGIEYKAISVDDFRISLSK